ncbi:hypothetical protein V7O62_02470 [Methanolobus sp. ZRKC2]|uniref:hypothetical protein n=1 Tax=Methanolobus sp. ZRKC2 TaxID=3125783 RepID=UPI00324B13DB
MDIEVKLRYMLINLNHFRRCMLSRIRYHLSSKDKKYNPSTAFYIIAAKDSHPEDGNPSTFATKIVIH